MSDVVYGWTGGAENSGLPFPIADQSSPNAARDIQKLAEHLPLDVDAAGVTDFGTDGPPMMLYGTSRPDEHGAGGEITAPVGSSYTFSGDGAQLEAVPVLGARVWRQTPTGWTVAEGRTPTFVLTGGAGQQYSLTRVNDIREYRLYQGNQTTKFEAPDFDSAYGWQSSGWFQMLPFHHYSNNNLTNQIIMAHRNGNVTITGEIWGDSEANGQALTIANTWPFKKPWNASQTTTLLIAELKAKIEENPELAEQLKAELEALQAGE